MMAFHQCWRGILCFGCCLAAANCFADGILSSTPADFAGGKISVCWRENLAVTDSTDLLIHLHGAPDTLRTALARTDLDAVMVAVNFNGLSAAYSRPFSSDPTLFQRILDHTSNTLAEQGRITGPPRWNRIIVSTFSAGFGAVRELLKSPETADRIDCLVAADSIYAGLDESQPGRVVSAENMAGFLKFAERAARGEKVFVLTHSSQPTPYASTTETADYLLKSLGTPRELRAAEWSENLHQTSSARIGAFQAFGFSGESGPEHLQHLRQIDLIWKRLPDAGQ